MNYRKTWYTLSQLILLEAVFMLIPFFIGVGYRDKTVMGFGITVAALAVIGIPGIIKKPKNPRLGAREGFVIVAFGWMLMSIFGCFPLFISGAFPNFADALFETVSGFTTTGATVSVNVELLPKSILYWRGFTQWLGGMGVLVLFIAILPKTDRKNIHIFRAESSLPQGSMLMTKLYLSARILYIIYLGLTIIQTVMLLCGGMPFFDSLIHTFATAGTGGFSSKNASIAAYNSLYIEIVITVFMLLYSINFNILFLLLVGKFRQAAKNDEVRWFLGIVFAAITAVTAVLLVSKTYSAFGLALKDSSFTVISIISSTGFSTTDYTVWPAFCQILIIIIMFVGSCAGSTGGGLKVSRVLVLARATRRDLRKSLNPNTVVHVKMDGKTVDESLIAGVKGYFIMYITLCFASIALISLTGDFPGTDSGIMTAVSAAISCLNNVGPGLGLLGPAGNYSSLSVFTKLVLCFDMLAGRLELLPMLLIFSPKIWRKA